MLTASSDQTVNHDAAVEWREISDALAWDRSLAAFGGHPLQSALWGDARRAVDGIRDHRWIAQRAGTPVGMIRVEERHVPGFGTIGWVPRGPTGEGFAGLGGRLPQSLAAILAEYGITLLVTDPWTRVPDAGVANAARHPRTIWVDLSVGKAQLWADRAKLRNGVGRARRSGVTVEISNALGDIEQFFSICSAISVAKRFQLPISLPIMKFLIGKANGEVDAHLFVARRQGRIGGGALILRCGRSIHYFCGGTDRQFTRECIGEALQWNVIEWATSHGCTNYDLEGIDPEKNAQVYTFKKQLRGEEITLPGKQYFPLGLRGRVFSWLDSLR